MDDECRRLWIGTWINEYGSELHIDRVEDGRVTGTFSTALGDSAFARTTRPVSGLCQGAALHFAFVSDQAPVVIASFTGLLRDNQFHAAWHVVTDHAVRSPQPGAVPVEMELPWAHAVLANSDTFHRQG